MAVAKKEIPSIVEDLIGGLSEVDRGSLEQSVSAKNPEEAKIKIVQSESLQDLRRVLGLMENIKGSQQEFSGQQVAKLVEEAEDFLDEYMDDIIIASMTGQENMARKAFAEKVNHITRGGDYDIRQKSKDLLKAKMEDYYYANRDNLLVKVIKNINSLDALSRVLDQIKIKEDDKIYSSEDLKQQINMAKSALEIAVSRGTLFGATDAEIDQEIDSVIRQIPLFKGLRKRTFFLLRVYVDRLMDQERQTRDNRVNSYVNQAARTSKLSKLWSWFRKR